MLQGIAIWPLKSLSEVLGIHWDSISQNGSCLGSVRVHSLTLSCTLGSVWCDSRDSSWSAPLQPFCLGREPKTRVATLLVSQELLLFALSSFFFVFVFLYLVFGVGFVASRWNGLNLLVTPKIVVETLTVRWCSLSTFTHCKKLMKSARNLWWSNPSCTCCYCQWSQKGCVRWQPLQWIQWLPRDLGVKYVLGLFDRTRISNNITRDLSIELCWRP